MLPLDSKKLLQTTLQSIDTMGKPVGAHKLYEELTKAGFEISLSSVGRYLMRFEEQGYIEKAENERGRVLTEKGKKKLASIALYNERSEVKEFFKEFLTETTIDNMIDRLVARRGVETEAARLAAERIDEDALNQMNTILNEEIVLKRRSLDSAPTSEMMDQMSELDRQFHEIIVRSSQNECLLNFFRLVAISSKMQSFYVYIAGHKTQDHINILESLRERNADAAARLIYDHISSVIESCRMYWDAKTTLDEYLTTNAGLQEGYCGSDKKLYVLPTGTGPKSDHWDILK